MRRYWIAAILCTLLAICTACDGQSEKSPGAETIPSAEITAAETEIAEEEPAVRITASVAGGIYDENNRPESVTLTTETDYTILYTTTSCREPDAYSQIADGAIRLPYNETGDGETECAILRAALFDGAEQVSATYTFTYYSAPEGRFTTPVISLVSDPVGLYSHETGILVEGLAREEAWENGNPPGWVLSNTNANFYNSGIDWERAAAIDFSESGEGTFTFSSDGGMRVNGGWTRANTQKSLKLFSRKTYTPESGTFALDLFPGYRDPLTGRTNSFANTILIRGGSNNENSSIIATPLQLKLCEGTGQILPAIRPVTEYINGEYRGLFYLIEDYDADFIEAHFGVPEEELAIFSGSFENYGGSMWTLDTGTEEDLEAFKSILETLGSMDMREEENYTYACEVFDMRNFIEYMCIELYCCNSDWPDNNLRVFKVKTGENTTESAVSDGRYRFLLKDLDLAFGSGHSVTSNPYNTLNSSSILGLREIFTKLLRNEEFADTVYMYMCTLASTVFEPDRVQETIDEFVLTTIDEMILSTDIMRVGGGSATAWQNNLNALMSFAKARDNAVLDATEKRSKRALTEVQITLVGEGEAEFAWYPAQNGALVTMIAETAIPLEVPANAAVEVTGGTYTDGTVIFSGESASLTITFGAAEEQKTADGVVINEVSYRGADEKFVELYNGGTGAVSLDGWSIGTTYTQSLDGYTIEAGGYLVIGEDVPMVITMTKNNTLYLYNGENIADSVDLFTVNRSVQLGRYPDGGEMITLYVSELTPGGSNAILEPFAWEILRSDGVMIGDRFYPTAEMEQIDGDYAVPVSILRNYLRDIRTVYKKEWDWVDEHMDETIPFGELVAFIDENMRIKVRYCASANVIIVG